MIVANASRALTLVRVPGEFEVLRSTRTQTASQVSTESTSSFDYGFNLARWALLHDACLMVSYIASQ